MFLIEEENRLIGKGRTQTNSQERRAESQEVTSICWYKKKNKVKKETRKDEDLLFLSGLTSVMFIGIPALAVIEGVSWCVIP